MMTTPIFELLKEGNKAKKGKRTPLKVSRKYEIEYTKQLLEITKALKKEGDEILEITNNSKRFVGDSAPSEIAIGDAPSWLTSIRSVVFGGITRKVKAASDSIAEKVVSRQQKLIDAQLAKQMKTMTGVEVQKIIKKEKLQNIVDDSIAANVNLINSIPTQYHEKLERLVLVALQNGKPQSWLETQVKRLGKTTDARARLIARDQMAKINGSITKARHEQLGVDKYTWETEKDERVRPEHEKRQSKVFEWANPPSGGHPSEAVNCRCGAVPYFGD